MIRIFVDDSNGAAVVNFHDIIQVTFYLNTMNSNMVMVKCVDGYFDGDGECNVGQVYMGSDLWVLVSLTLLTDILLT